MKATIRLFMIFLPFCSLCRAEANMPVRLCTEKDTTYYSDFPSALAKANKSPEAAIELLDDVTFGGAAKVQTVKTHLLLDLNGYSLGDTLTGTSLLYLNTDSLSLTIRSSRPGGRIWAARPHNGRINTINGNKGRLQIEGIRIEGHNTADTVPLPSASAACVAVGVLGSLTIRDCVLESGSTGAALGIAATGNKTGVSEAEIERCRIHVSAHKSSYGISAYTTVSIRDSEIEVTADSATVYGIFLNTPDTSLHRTGTARINNTHLYVSAPKNAYGLHNKGQLEMYESSLYAEADTTARAVVLAAGSSAILQACALRAGSKHPAAKNTYALYGNNTAQAALSQCTLTAEGVETVYGITNGSQLRIDHCTIRTEAAGLTSYGVYISNYRDAETEQDVCAGVLHTRIDVSSAKTAYALYTMAPVEAGYDTLNARSAHENSYALYANTDTIVRMSNSLFTAEAGYHSAYGVYLKKGRMDAEQCTFSTTAHQDTVQTKPQDSYARAVYINANGRGEIHGCRLRSKGTNPAAAKNVYGLYVHASSWLMAENTTIEASGTENIYGVSCGGHTRLTNCTIQATASATTAYAVRISAATDSIEIAASITGCYIKAAAPAKAYVVYKNTAMEGQLFFYGGYFSHNENLRMYLPEGYSLYKLSEGEAFNDGYTYAIRPISDPDMTVARVYNNLNGSLLGSYKRLADALRFVQFSDGEYTVIVDKDCQLGGGTYYVPYYAALVIACREGQSAPIGATAQRSDSSVKKKEAFTHVEILDGTELVVEGILEVSALQQSEGALTGTVSGATGYGHLCLYPGSSVQLESGSSLYAWGYITGSGTVHALKGSAVHEFLQIGDWKGGTTSFELMNNPEKVFPITHFFYQNIESPVVYHKGSQAIGSTIIKISTYTATHDDIRIIDDKNALFVMNGGDEDTYIQKEYNPQTDRLVWTTRGDIAMQELSIRMTNPLVANYSLISTQYILPIGSHMTIRPLSGTLTTANDIALLPGAIVEVGEDARIRVPANTALYLYDTEQWGTYNNKTYCTVSYSPSWDICPRDTVLSSARLVLDGQATIEGALYTTESGADITASDSSNGQITFLSGAPANGVIYQITGDNTTHQMTPQTAIPAALRNADNTMAYTAMAQPGETFRYTDGFWLSDREPDPPLPSSSLTPQTDSPRRLIIDKSNVYILTPEGKIYTLTGARLR